MDYRRGTLVLVQALRKGFLEVGCLARRSFSRAPESQYWMDRQGYEHFSNQGGSGNAAEFMRRNAVAIVVGGGVLGGVIYYRGLETVPYTHRSHWLAVSPEVEKMLGEAQFAEMKEMAQAQGTLLPENHMTVKQIRSILSRLTPMAAGGYGGGDYRHMEGLNWDVAVIDSNMVGGTADGGQTTQGTQGLYLPEVNAAVLPGGKVVVYGGLLRTLTSQEQLAAVLAHEVGHIVARHHSERLTRAQLATLFSLVMFWLTGFQVRPLAALVFDLPFSRLHEHEADAIGLRMMGRACFEPDAFVQMLERLHLVERRTGAAKVPALLSTHPLTPDRVKRMTEALPDAQQDYQNSGCASAIEFMEKLSQARGSTW